jgi:hypothetical protein
MMVQGAHYILGPFGEDSDLRRWGRKLAERGGKNAKKRAVVAVARKLAVLLHRLWVGGEVYEPLRNSQKAMREVAPRVAIRIAELNRRVQVTATKSWGPPLTESVGTEVDSQVAAPTETRIPTWHRANIAHQRVRMEGWRQRRLG